MTPNSTDRIGALSPLDSLLTQGHPPASLKAGQAFESVLNRPTESTGIVSLRTPPSRAHSSTQRNQTPLSRVDDSRSEDARPLAPVQKKGSTGTIHGLKSRPDPKEEDQDRDSAGNAGTTRNDAAAPPPASTPPNSQTEQDSPTEQPATASVDADSGDGGGQKQVPVLDETSASSLLPAAGATESPTPADAELAPADGEATTVPPDSTADPQPTDPQGLAIVEAVTTNTELTEPATTTAPQTTDTNPQENPAPLEPRAALDAAPAATLEVSPVDQPGKKDKDQSDADQSNNSDFAQFIDSQTNADATASPLNQPPAAANDAAAVGVQAAAAPQPAPESPTAAATPPTGAVQGLTSRLPSHVLAQAESHHGRAAAPVVVDSARFLSRVAKAFLSAQQRDGEVRLRLSPPELGSLRLQVSVQDGVMVARMETETEAARASLTNNLPELRERLAEQGIRIERFDIDLMQQPSLGTPDRPTDSQQQPERQPLHSLRTDQPKSGTATPTTTPDSNWSGQGRLNVII